MKASCIQIARAVLGNPLSRSADELLFRCPNHDDQHPSLKINENKNAWLCGPCGASGNPWKLAAFFGHLDPNDNPSVVEWLRSHNLFNGSSREIVATYPYTDEGGKLLYEVLRFEPKDFRQRRPDGSGGHVWSLNGTRRVLYQLPEVLKTQTVLICEGEKDCHTARPFELTATTNVGGAGKWRPEYSECLRQKRICIIADKDEPGLKHARAIAASVFGIAEIVKIIELPDAKDLTEWVERGGTRDALIEIIKSAREVTREDVAIFRASPQLSRYEDRNSWSAAQDARAFIETHEEEVDTLEPRLLFPGSITELFSPRGLGKTHVAHFIAVKLARAGKRVLILDRDNSRREVRRRLRGWGALDAPGLKVLTRDQVPPLTNTMEWATFPFADYDLVLIDSIDSSAEGVGEQDSAKPARAIAPLLDIAHREKGPAILLLGNTIKDASHSRGSGVIEDRADIVYEVRDATDLVPSGQKPWVEELPPADAGSWAARSTRRQRRDTYRLACVPTKFRVGEEPEPFILEVNLSAEPWTVSDATDAVDRAGADARAERESQTQTRQATGVIALINELYRRQQAGEGILLKGDAETFLMSTGLKRQEARQVLESGNQTAWDFERLPGMKGRPVGVIVKSEGGKTGLFGGNTTAMIVNEIAGQKGAHFRRPVSMHPAEIGIDQTSQTCGSQRPLISAEESSLPPLEGISAEMAGTGFEGEI